MTARFLHPPRTGGSSIVVGWALQGTDEYQKHAGPTPADFSYGFVRNPWDRLVSIYHRTRHYPDMPFVAWVRKVAEERANPTDAERLKPIDWLRPCAFWMMGATFVGRFENRARHLELVANLLRRPVPERHEGATEREPYQAYYDGFSREWVEREYAVDINLYGYTYA